MGVRGESLPTVSVFEVNPTSSLESLRIWLERAILPALRSKISSR
ncbi:hypothetical protein SLEP1_g25729 [Rubroshorea leprosula]|uniref:Uncharacterized protein n=1 Tax=Rubroshorea leprosula TaxID=152421 RepID=A0AAV5JUI3_9ROSI|nr:hypothetical protein SLEP1_g25729 [Rubroshorea leprosula]